MSALKLSLLCLLFTQFGFARFCPSEYKPITVVVLSYNNKAYYKKNLASILSQRYPNFRLVYIDDCSTDGTYEAVRDDLKSFDKQRVVLKRNTVRVGAMANFYHAVRALKDHEIVVMVDGDDWLAHDAVLERINQAYADPSIWLTYGQHLDSSDGCLGACRKIRPNQSIRSQAFVSTHLKTFYAALFKKVAKEDLCVGKRFLPVCSDLAAMLPMLEMARDHVLFIPEVLYIYNQGNPLSDQHLNAPLQRQISQTIRSLPAYDALGNTLGPAGLQ